MAFDKGQSKEVDLDRTDKLPILEGISIDEDVEDDSVRLEYSATLPGTVLVASPAAVPEVSPERAGFALARRERAIGGGAHRPAKRRLRSAEPPVRESARCAARGGHARR